MKVKYRVYNRSSDTVSAKAGEETFLLTPYSTYDIDLTAGEHKVLAQDTRLIVRSRRV